MNFKVSKVIFFFTLFFLSVGFSLNDYQKKPKTIYNLRQIVSSYPEEALVKNLRNFVSCCKKGRLVGTKSHDLAYTHLKKTVQKSVSAQVGIGGNQFKPDVDHAMMIYRDQLEKALSQGLERDDEDYQKLEYYLNQKIGFLEQLRESEGKSLIWEKRGLEQPKEVLILMAHYDNIVYKDGEEGKAISRDAQMPGADKNASGVALLLSMVEILHQVELPKTVRLIFLDFGEFESLGAKALAENWKKNQSDEKVAGALNVMMVGHSSKNNHKEGLEHDMRLYTLKEEGTRQKHEKLASFVKKIGDKMGTPIKTQIDSWERGPTAQNYFSRADIPSLLYTQNWEQDANPRVHTSNDFVETLNFKTLHGNLRYLSGVVLAWAFDLE